MSILDTLASRSGERTQKPNEAAALRCLDNPKLLAEIEAGLAEREAPLVADCAEVMTMVAQQRPELIAPHAQQLAKLLSHKNTRVRWESMHAIALVAHLAPKVIGALLPELDAIVRNDASVIVRDYAVQAVASYASSGAREAKQALPVLIEALTVWNGKQAHHALNGLASAVKAAPRLAPELSHIASRYIESERGVVRKGAKNLQKAIESQ